MSTIVSQITSLTIVYSAVYSDADHRKHQSSASLAFVRGIHRGPVNSTHKWPVTRKMFPFDDVIMNQSVIPIIVFIEAWWRLNESNNWVITGSGNGVFPVWYQTITCNYTDFSTIGTQQ